MIALTYILPLLMGWVLDLILGDPQWMPHPVVGFGKMIALGEKQLNKGSHRKLKGALLAIFLVALVFVVIFILDQQLSNLNALLSIAFRTLIIFWCLAGTTLIREVRQTFLAVDRSLEEGRKQVARIVGRDTTQLSAQEIRTAALEAVGRWPALWVATLQRCQHRKCGRQPLRRWPRI